ncbi:MAG: hypothetical protein ABI570_08605, partial [Ilumatobacteraceae bacterium]
GRLVKLGHQCFRLGLIDLNVVGFHHDRLPLIEGVLPPHLTVRFDRTCLIILSVDQALDPIKLPTLLPITHHSPLPCESWVSGGSRRLGTFTEHCGAFA